MKRTADKQQWMEQVMNSLNDLPPATPPRGLYERIETGISKRAGEKTRIIPLKTVSAAAAVLLLLLALNTITLMGRRQTAGGTNSSSIDAVTRYYDLNNDYVHTDL